jgi:hypothetical protein
MKNFIWMIPALLLCGCAGSRCQLAVHSVNAPISCTPCVLNASGQIHQVRPNEIVKHFELTKSNWSMLWTIVPLNHRQWDPSPEINAKLQAAGGNAVANVTVHAAGSDFLDWYIAALVGVLPSYVTVTVQGDIVRIPDAAP